MDWEAPGTCHYTFPPAKAARAIGAASALTDDGQSGARRLNICAWLEEKNGRKLNAIRPPKPILRSVASASVRAAYGAMADPAADEPAAMRNASP